MKKPKTSSKLHIVFIVAIFVSLACMITALCLFSYNFDASFAEIWQADMPALILCGSSLVLDLALIVSAVILRVKNDERTRGEVGLAFMIAIVLLLETALCVPIFVVWVIERIHDSVSMRRRETL